MSVHDGICKLTTVWKDDRPPARTILTHSRKPLAAGNLPIGHNTSMVSRTPTTGTTPAALGFSMPAEWEPHEATWLAWPHNPTDWPDKLDTIRWVYAEIVRKIAPGETIRMLVNSAAAQKQARRYLTRSGADAGRVEFLIHPTDRGWTRDSGPIFVRRGQGHRGFGTGRDRPRLPGPPARTAGCDLPDAVQKAAARPGTPPPPR